MIPSLTLISRKESLLTLIGNTPLIRIEKIADGLISPEVKVFAKAEWYNPGGSVKDRPALSMIQDGERSGKLVEGKTIIDATSGNTGIAYAMIGAVLGYPVELALPSNAGNERKRILAAYGARIIPTDPLEGTDGAQRVVKEIVARDPDRYFFPDQYNNPANWRAHFNTTAPEILTQTGGTVSHFVAGLGTTGTFVGISRKLKKLNPSIRCISFEPDSPLHGLEGLKHLPASIVPGIYDPEIADESLHVSTEDAYRMVRRLAAEEGLFVGPSSGAALCAAIEVARGLSEGTVVTVFPDDGSKYISERFWKE